DHEQHRDATKPLDVAAERETSDRTAVTRHLHREHPTPPPRNPSKKDEWDAGLVTGVHHVPAMQERRFDLSMSNRRACHPWPFGRLRSLEDRLREGSAVLTSAA